MARATTKHGVRRQIAAWRLQDRVTPAFAGYYAVGAGVGSPPRVQLFRDGELQLDFVAYDPSFLGGANVAIGDFNGDETPDIVTGAGFGGGSHVRIFSGTDSTVIGEFFAYRDQFLGGVNVAVGDVTGDLVPDIITAPASNGGPDVRVFDGTNLRQVSQITPYDLRIRGGINIAAGDVNGDGFDEVVTVPARGATHVRVFDVRDANAVVQEFYAYDSKFRGGASVAAADLNLDEAADIITGAGQGGGPHVKIFSGGEPEFVLNQWLAYEANFLGGVRVGAADLDSNGRLDVITAPGPGGGPDVRTFNPQNAALLSSRFVFSPNFLGGVTTTDDPSVFDLRVSATYISPAPVTGTNYVIEGTTLTYGTPARNAIGAGQNVLTFTPTPVVRIPNAVTIELGRLSLVNRITDPGTTLESVTLNLSLDLNGSTITLPIELDLESTTNVASPETSEDTVSATQDEPIVVRVPGLGQVAVSFLGFATPASGPITQTESDFRVRETRSAEVIVVGRIKLLNT